MGDNRTPRDPQLPTHWFNILHDRPQYVTSAVSRSRLGGEAKTAGHGALLQQPLSLARQSINTADRLIPIPDEVLDLYAQYRPTPLRRAARLEERFGITMGDADLLPENFASVNAICAYLRSREAGKQESAHG